MSGRRDQFALHKHEKDFLPRLRQIAGDLEAGRTTEKKVADYFGWSVKTVQRTMAKLKKRDGAVATYAPVEGWKQLPSIEKWELWANNRSRKWVYHVREIWEKVWGKKVLQLLTKDDMTAAVDWVKKQSEGRRYSLIQALRALIRGGYGEHGWLTECLDTKGFKSPARIPPELKSKETFYTVMPRLFHALDKLRNDGAITRETHQTQHLVERLKSTLGARTGDREAMREVWGTIINNPKNGKSSLMVDETGKLLHWTVFAKKKEVWEIPRSGFEAYPGLAEEVEEYIRSRGLKTGDYLVTGLEQRDSLQLIAKQCKMAELSHYTLHDLRKIAATTSILAGVPLEITAEMGVGWRDLDTLRDYYITIKGARAEQGYAKVAEFLRENETTEYSPHQKPVEKPVD